jgi:predicted ATPase/signal transduction histidine kinase
MISIPGYKIKEQESESTFFSEFRGARDSDGMKVRILFYNIPYASTVRISKFRLAQKIRENPAEGVVNVYGVVKAESGTAVILEDFDGIPLNEIIAEIKNDLSRCLEIAVRLASALEELHKNNVTHENINSSNVLIDKKTGKVKITLFSTSIMISREIRDLYNPLVIKNILPYISPEQTGRMNRDMDYRTDFYSLGIVLYEMLTGKPPFTSGDPMELVHSHIAKEPAPPVEADKKIPAALSDIIMKLLKKTSEERYQSARGLKLDLEECTSLLRKTGKADRFTLGRNDASNKFRIPQKLYGREQETEFLIKSFENACLGEKEIMTVTGYSGVGKSVLVYEIQKPVVMHRGYFISGKYDQYARNIPYNAIIQAFHALIKQLLSESGERINVWKEKLLDALRNNGQVIIDIIPEVELITGKQPPVPRLGPAESQNRFNMVFQNFIGVFAQKEHPLVLFLDDLQWIDLASLNLIKNLITEPQTQYLYIIGAYRDEEVSGSHPLMLSLDEIKKTGFDVKNVSLSPLQESHVNRLIAETLNRGIKETQELTGLIYKKTGGNPFFVKQFLTSLHEENMLVIDENFVWQWDIKKISRMQVTENVLNLMIQKINKLSGDAQNLLKIASCIGGKFDLETLSAAYEKPEEEMFSDLNESVSEGHILTFDGAYGFSHDRIQEAAYSMIPDDEKIQIHYKISNSVLKYTKKEELEEKIFFLCDQFDSCKELITEKEKKIELAELNLKAGRKAKASNAYASAARYLTAGTELLPEDTWQSQYKLTYSLYMERAECEYLTGNFDEAEKVFDVILNNAKTDLEKAKVYEIKALLYTHESKPIEAVRAGTEGLKLFGLNLPLAPGKITVLSELLKIKWGLRGKKIKDLMYLPHMTDPDQKAIMNLLMIMAPSTFFISADLYILTQLKMVNISLRHGNTEVSSFAYGAYGFIIGSGLGDFKTGYEFGQLAIKLSEKFNDLALIGKTNFMMGCFINHWTMPAKSGVDYLMKTYQDCLESGDLMFAGYAVGHIIMRKTMNGDTLDDLYAETEKYLDFLQRTKNYNEADYYIVVQRMVLNLKGQTMNQFSFSDDKYDEDKHVERMKKNKQQVAIHWYYIIKLQMLYLFENYSEAMKLAKISDKMLDVSLGLQQVPEHYFYYSLTLAAIYPKVSDKEKKNYLKILNSNREKMKKWADNCPENFLHKYLLIAAEMARVTGKDSEAMDLYGKAAKSAGENEYIQNEAISNELAGKFHLSKGRDVIAKAYLSEARAGYLKWGATAKVADLDEKYHSLIGKLPVAEGGGAEALDVKTVLKASQAISGEILLDRLLGKLMHIMLENAGAEKGFLLLEKKDKLFIEAEGSVGREEVKMLKSIPPESNTDISEGIVNYVKRTRETVVLDDAAKTGEFTQDPYVLKNRTKSILCIPIVKQATLIGILYLENNLAANAFTSDRVDILNVLCSQAAISLENALLYDELDLRVRERTADLAKANVALRNALEQLKELDKLKDEFFSSAAHEIKNPLTPVKIQSQMLLKNHFGEINEKQKQSVETILRNTNRLIRLTDDILTISKMKAGVLKYEMEENNLVNIIENSFGNMELTAKDKKINLVKKHPEQLPEVKCDRDRINQVIENLIGNALKFTPENGRITVEAKQTGNEIIVSVEDTGIGISPENQGKIFNTFFQVSSKYGGTGLGLTICKNIVEAHHGRMWVESEIGKGSKFIFTLPVKQ